jgi:hypothetical protein
MSQMLWVTPSVGRQSLGHVFAGDITCCDPEIALALFVFYPGKAAGLLACYEARSKGHAKRLLERDALAFAGEPATTATAMRTVQSHASLSLPHFDQKTYSVHAQLGRVAVSNLIVGGENIILAKLLAQRLHRSDHKAAADHRGRLVIESTFGRGRKSSWVKLLKVNGVGEKRSSDGRLRTGLFICPVGEGAAIPARPV